MTIPDQRVERCGGVDRSLRRRLIIASLIEGTTLSILLFVAVPLRYVLGFHIATQVVGPIHGLAFVAYFILVTEYFISENRSATQWILFFATAFVPLGAFITARKLYHANSPH